MKCVMASSPFGGTSSKTSAAAMGDLSEALYVVLSAARGSGVFQSFQPDADIDAYRCRLCRMATNELRRLTRARR